MGPDSVLSARHLGVIGIGCETFSVRIGHDGGRIGQGAVEGYTEKGWIRVKFEWGVKNLQRGT